MQTTIIEYSVGLVEIFNTCIRTKILQLKNKNAFMQQT
jgi:hypothetical protein